MDFVNVHFVHVCRTMLNSWGNSSTKDGLFRIAMGEAGKRCLLISTLFPLRLGARSLSIPQLLLDALLMSLQLLQHCCGHAIAPICVS